METSIQEGRQTKADPNSSSQARGRWRKFAGLQFAMVVPYFGVLQYALRMA